MAQGTDRAPFPDDEHPLYTPDEDAQRQVVARIAQARRGNGKRARKKDTGADYRIEQAAYLPMEQHRIIGRDALAAALGGAPKTADKLVKEHPEDMDPWQVRQLCDLCGVTLEWLRGWEDVNAYGKYETAETVAAMYSHLSNEDRALVCDLLTRLLGADEVRAIEYEQWERDNSEWLKRNPEKAREIHDMISRATRATLEPVADAVRAAWAIVAARFTDEERELMRKTADELQAQGEDASGLTPDELLARARGDSVEG